ncbi:hypothetical protein LOY67_01365 [Pseudomonas sp. B21-056]|jgi:hypothetical protein|uniref:hypothetical protein n=1 Tax=Pseudomonas sp. B21-056 TaxID=2895495 RepID=UPI00222FB116|nr:hypothetical protein [Pseudomonas sp. B21-056]UZE24091.1 hypothetical protein LOY67_01365 [Pseudomonas sp. B21-056]
MQISHPPVEQYQRLNSTPVLVIDTEADLQHLCDAAAQRIQASSNLLETLHCLCFKHADVKDIPSIVHALYLLVQDGHELLEVVRQRLR